MKRLKPEINACKAPETNGEIYRELEVDTLARTLWGEARGEGEEGMQAVANVILKRLNISYARGGMWWGNNIIQICQKPYQFSCWNKDDPNFKQVLNVDKNDLHFATALRVARRAVFGLLSDITDGADHYHAKSVEPFWARHQTPVCIIGSHIFYTLTEA